ncbi:Fur family transcriptional regulator [Mesoplasma corruscae]|uniref:Fur family transcriptional regulator n=1 Tax=Mesoplasma corruscae TaxID=216874 RepID=A0A2S5RHI6_9MOLU|nr:transcriptional repressor [Mesoplasma corruscae]PPE06747.1 Fur family transcriptional regulator [Mesoplasma corruscae]
MPKFIKEDFRYEAVINELKQNKIKLTDIRVKIIKVLLKNNHLSTQEIIEELQKNNKSINAMSVYNTIDLFLKKHIIFSNTFDGKNIGYELSSLKSIHIKCDSCYSVDHVSEELEKLWDIKNFESLVDNKNAKIEHVKIEIHVTCKNCRLNSN